MKDKEKIIKILIERGNNLLKQPREKLSFTDNPKADEFFDNLEEYPHFFVLACVMDRQIKAERAWLIPYSVSKEIGSFEFKKLLEFNLEQFKEMFKKNSFHRFNDTMAKIFYEAVQLIYNKYDSDASNIWKNNPKSATVVRRFLEFKGVGIKIATMATNILVRDFKIPMENYICIDISPDVHVKRVFKRLGFIPEDSTVDELIYCTYCARELNPNYPGIFDFSCFEIGREWCRPQNPKCKECYLNEYCPKVM